MVIFNSYVSLPEGKGCSYPHALEPHCESHMNHHWRPLGETTQVVTVVWDPTTDDRWTFSMVQSALLRTAFCSSSTWDFLNENIPVTKKNVNGRGFWRATRIAGKCRKYFWALNQQPWHLQEFDFLLALIGVHCMFFFRLCPWIDGFKWLQHPLSWMISPFKPAMCLIAGGSPSDFVSCTFHALQSSLFTRRSLFTYAAATISVFGEGSHPLNQWHPLK